MAVTHDAAAELSMGLIRMMKLFQSLRQHAPRIHPSVDAASYPLLFNLAVEPRRVSALAECVHSDISTVSRQVSHLVGLGFAEKVTDPDDGRAQVITLTSEGGDLLERLKYQRAEWFRSMLQDWPAEEVAAFTAYVERFGGVLEQARSRAQEASHLSGATSGSSTSSANVTAPTSSQEN